MRNLVVFSGAGLSAESGLETFRGNGMWDSHNIDVVCNYHTWQKNYDLVHRFYESRREAIALALPNAAHLALAALETEFSVTHLTQNIDNLLERAGCTNVTHLHGVCDTMTCCKCGDMSNAIDHPPESRTNCPVCDAHQTIKPNVVFFNESAPAYDRLYSVVDCLTKDDIVLVVGTSNVVIDFGMLLMGSPATHYEINPAPSGSYVFRETFSTTATQGMGEFTNLLKQSH